MKRTHIVLLGIVGLLVAATLGAVFISTRDTAKLDVSYYGGTNQHKIAFTISNGSRAAVVYWVGLPQVNTNGVWPRPHITANDGELPAPTILAPGGKATVVVAQPSNGGQWRLPVFWQVQGEGMGVGGIIRYNLRVLKGWWRVRRYNAFPGISLHGDEVVRTGYSTTIAG